MDKKIVVQLKKFTVTQYAYQKLKYCLNCGIYTTLENEPCPTCGKTDKFTSIEKQMLLNTKSHFRIQQIRLLMLFFTAIVFAQNITHFVIALAAGAALFFMLYRFQKQYLESEAAANIHKLAQEYGGRIYEDLKKDTKTCNEDISAGDYKKAYEKYRNLGVLIQNDYLRQEKLKCLSRFILRSDMELELDTLVIEDYNTTLMQYISEVAKLNRSLINSKVIDYILRYEDRILEEEPNGKEILANAAGAIIRTKPNIIRYQNFIRRHVAGLSKERLKRLCLTLQNAQSEGLGDLYRETMQVVRENYRNDLEFKEFLA